MRRGDGSAVDTMNTIIRLFSLEINRFPERKGVLAGHNPGGRFAGTVVPIWNSQMK